MDRAEAPARRSFFVESRRTARLYRVAGASAERRVEVHAGAGAERAHDTGGTYEWTPLGARPPSGAFELPAAARRRAAEIELDPFDDEAALADHDALASELEAVAAGAGAAHLNVSVREVEQRVMWASGDDVAVDRRAFAAIGLRAVASGDARASSAYRARAYPDRAALARDRDALRALVDELCAIARAKTLPRPFPTGVADVVLAPGATATFFHEVVGHPLEGDVVASGSSYLARAAGTRVAEPFVTIADDPSHPCSTASYATDDEGVAGRRVALVDAGVVASPLLDRRSAAALGRASNGHGRRLDYRFPALPRMSHTEVAAHHGALDDVVASTRRGIVVFGFDVRHVNLADGSFSFYVPEARRLDGGVAGAYLGPGVVHGRGLDALASIDAVGADAAGFFPGAGGCGKLDQGPLYVSFAQPTVRIRALGVRAWRTGGA